eukprot:s742_g3.t2
MKAQLREKTEKEELYRSRIEYLQQQIDVYNQYAARATVRLSSPRMAPASPRDARARSLRHCSDSADVTSSAVAERQAQVGDRLRLAAAPQISISCLAAQAQAARPKVAATIAAGALKLEKLIEFLQQFVAMNAVQKRKRMDTSILTYKEMLLNNIDEKFTGDSGEVSMDDILASVNQAIGKKGVATSG